MSIFMEIVYLGEAATSTRDWKLQEQEAGHEHQLFTKETAAPFAPHDN
jgi:hypothetical protein